MSTTDTPWKDWIPGVLSKKQLRELSELAYMTGATKEPGLYDYSSMDLTIGDEGYCLIKGAIKPQVEYGHFLASENELVQSLKPDIDGSVVLEQKKTYVFKLQQRLSTRLKSYDNIYGQATARSSVGRLDVLARLIVDGMDRYEGFIPSRIANGDMFIEITPLTFNIRVKPGIPLSQLRLFYGNPENSIITGKELFKTVLPNDTIPDNERDGCLTLDLDNTQIGAKHELGAAFQAVPNDEPISLWTTEPKADAKKYWKLKSPTVIGSQKRLEIDNKAFYILRSKQRIRLTQNVAVYCRATDETFGEMRIHYAGFAHPFFGRERKDHGIHGTPLCFEVRGHDVQVVLTHGEKMAELVFYRMSEDCEQETTERRYTDQDLQLSSFFGDWES